MQKAQKKLENNAKTHQTLKQPHPPGIKPGYPKCIPDESPVSVQQHDLSLTEASLKKKLAGPTGATGRPYGPRVFFWIFTDFCQFQEDIWSP